MQHKGQPVKALPWPAIFVHHNTQHYISWSQLFITDVLLDRSEDDSTMYFLGICKRPNL